jgi:hypothetical protein
MSVLKINLDYRLKRRLEARAAATGHESIASYAEEVLRADAADPGAPPHLHFESDAELERMLLERMNDKSPRIEVTPRFWSDLRKKIAKMSAARAKR